jgi:hypothetical protein
MPREPCCAWEGGEVHATVTGRIFALMLGAGLSLLGGGCAAISMVVSTAQSDLAVTSATDFSGADDTIAQQALAWESNSSGGMVSVVVPIKAAKLHVGIGPANRSVVVTEAGLDTFFTFDDGVAYEVGAGAKIRDWILDLTYAWTDLDDVSIRAGANQRDLMYESSGLGLRLGYDGLFTAALDFDFGEVKLTETRITGTRTIDLEPDTSVSLVLGYRGGSEQVQSFAELSLIGVTGIRVGMSMSF